MSANDSDNSRNRLGLALVCNSLPPYRVHLHRRIVREMPEVKFWTICTHEGTDARWGFDPPAEINTVSFGLQPGVADLPGINRESFRKGGAIIRWLRENDVRVVIMFGYNDIGRARIIRWCRKNGIPCFVFGDSNIRGDIATGIRAVLKRIFLGWVVRNTIGQFPCGSLGRAFFEKYGASPEAIFYFPYEPDYDQIFSLPDQTIETARQRYGLAPGRRRIVFSGRFVQVKRPDLLLEAFIRIAPQRPEWDLIMVGDGVMNEQLRAMVPAELADRIIWTGFVHDQPMVSAIYRASDVLVLPSNNEPWALVVNEAVAAGMAVVASDVVGAAVELVRDGVNGRLVRPNDVDALTECLLDVTRPDRIDAMRAASPMILQDWRRRADPIQELRRALAWADVLPQPASRHKKACAASS
jgi:glycosyltransferase involved in cell wall biosynthesis